MTDYTSNDLIKLSKSEKDARMRIRLLAVARFLETRNRALVATQLGVSRTSVNRWVSGYLAAGIEGLKANMVGGNANRLSDEQKQLIFYYVHKQSKSDIGGRLTGKDIQFYIKEHFKIDYHLNHAYKLLKSIGLSWITSRSKHPKQSIESQEEFKKTGN